MNRTPLTLALLAALTLLTAPLGASTAPTTWGWTSSGVYSFRFPAPHVPGVTKVTLAPGENVSTIAQASGLSVDTILSFNKIRSPRLLRSGQVLKLPPTDGVLLQLDKPTKVMDLAANYKLFPALIEVANRLPALTSTVEGDVFLPGVQLEGKERRQLLGELFAWPTKGGHITSRFGKRNDPFTGELTRHSGVDIGNYWGAPVLAAGSGVVIYTGFNSILGNHIVADQGGGYKVVYGHLSSILTKPGRRIVGGQLIGKVGSTGYSTGPHLHFSAYFNNRLMDPMKLFA